MTGLTLTLRDSGHTALDLSPLQPQTLSTLSPTALKRVAIPSGNRSIKLADLFDIQRTSLPNLQLRGMNAACHRIGRGMAGGMIEVEGDVGDEIGRDMRAGQIRISGSAGIGAGSGMRGGYIRIAGNADEALGSPAPGACSGLNGGLVTVDGSVGPRCGERMRRGMIVIGRDAGSYLASRMFAGTIVVLGKNGERPGLGMKRGSLFLSGELREDDLTRFKYCGMYEFGVVTLMSRYLANYHARFAQQLATYSFARRWCGDTLYGGTGEVLLVATK